MRMVWYRNRNTKKRGELIAIAAAECLVMMVTYWRFKLNFLVRLSIGANVVKIFNRINKIQNRYHLATKNDTAIIYRSRSPLSKSRVQILWIPDQELQWRWPGIQFIFKMLNWNRYLGICNKNNFCLADHLKL